MILHSLNDFLLEFSDIPLVRTVYNEAVTNYLSVTCARCSCGSLACTCAIATPSSTSWLNQSRWDRANGSRDRIRSAVSFVLWVCILGLQMGVDTLLNVLCLFGRNAIRRGAVLSGR